MITTAGSSNSSTLLPITSLGLPLTGSAAAGFAIGFMKGRMEKNKERRNQDYFLIRRQHHTQAASRRCQNQ
jgi:predicted alpha/beta-hydrolase family hydrolase